MNKVFLQNLFSLQEIQEIRFDGLSGAKEILDRTRTLVKEYRVATTSSQPQSTDPPPPYSPNPYYFTSPYNPYYLNPRESSETSVTGDGPSGLYPTVRTEEELNTSIPSAKIWLKLLKSLNCGLSKPEKRKKKFNK